MDAQVRTSEKLDRLLPALAAMQAELEPVQKNKINPHFKSYYADLSAVMDAVQPLLRKHGLLLMQFMADGGPQRAALDVRIYHVESGQWMGCLAVTDIGQATPQGTAGAVTYMRRYSLCALGVLTERDDDGNSASGPVHGQRSDSRPAARQQAAGRPSNGRTAGEF